MDYNELKVTLKALGFDLKKKEVQEIMKEYDPDSTGFIEYTDFLDLSIIKSEQKIWGKRSTR